MYVDLFRGSQKRGFKNKIPRTITCSITWFRDQIYLLLVLSVRRALPYRPSKFDFNTTSYTNLENQHSNHQSIIVLNKRKISKATNFPSSAALGLGTVYNLKKDII